MSKMLSHLAFSAAIVVLALAGAPRGWAAGGENPPGSPTGESPYGAPPSRQTSTRPPDTVRRARPPRQRISHSRRIRREAVEAGRRIEERQAEQRRAEERQERRRARIERAAEARREAARRARLARGAPPPASETRLRPSEVLVVVRSGLSDAAINALIARHRLAQIEVAEIALTGEAWRLWRASDNRTARALVQELTRESGFARVQPNYVYTLAETAGASAMPQYALGALRAEGIDATSSGEGVRVAVIDSMIDENHPDLKAAIEARFDAIGTPASPHVHGTAIAGAIAAQGAVRGVAPRARLLAVRAFEVAALGVEGATLNILKGVDWAVAQGARIVNMSFAGPPDPALARALQAAAARRVLPVAASGNAGARSQPLYPAADPAVIAVAASDAGDGLYAGSVRGAHVRLAAPGVDVLLPAVGGKYDLETGTSVAAALVSGVAALVAQRDPSIDSQGLLKLLLRTARPLATGGAGIGLVDARRAIGEREKAGAGR